MSKDRKSLNGWIAAQITEVHAPDPTGPPTIAYSAVAVEDWVGPMVLNEVQPAWRPTREANVRYSPVGSRCFISVYGGVAELSVFEEIIFAECPTP